MLSYFLRRLLYIFPVSFAVVATVGLLIHLIPGDPVDMIAGDFATEASKEEIRTQLGLNLPLYEQVGGYYVRIFRGDLGASLVVHRPVLDLMVERALPTLELALAALLFSCLVGIPLGAWCAWRARGPLDHAAMSFAFVGISMPNFLLGPLLILLFAVELRWVPVSGRSDWSSLCLPVLTLGSGLSAVLLKMSRTSFLGQLQEDYVRTAYAKGLNGFQVFYKHILKNASIPISTIVGLQLGVLVTGVIITEKVFDWPGIGTLITESIERRDYPVVQGCVFVFSITFLLTNLLTDLFYHALDPRIRGAK